MKAGWENEEGGSLSVTLSLDTTTAVSAGCVWRGKKVHSQERGEINIPKMLQYEELQYERGSPMGVHLLIRCDREDFLTV